MFASKTLQFCRVQIGTLARHEAEKSLTMKGKRMKKVTEQEQREMSEDSYIEGMMAVDDFVHNVIHRLQNSIDDFATIEDKDLSRDWLLIGRFRELYENAYFEKLDEIKYKRELERYKEDGIIQ